MVRHASGWRPTDRIIYRDTLAWARENGNDALAEELEAIGPPPYAQMLSYETSNSHEQSVYPYDHSMNSEGEAQMSENLIADEYALIDEVPVFFAQGAHEARGRAALFDEWYPI